MNSKQIQLETARLFVSPLTYDQLIRYGYEDNHTMENFEYDIHYRNYTEELSRTISSYLVPYINVHQDAFLFATIWLMIHKDSKDVVGDIGFNAGPTEKGVIEVGYSTYPHFMNRGYMTEALAAMTTWAFAQPNVTIVIAQTDKGNAPSHRVLQKNNFEPFAEADQLYWWRLDKLNEIN